MAHPSVPVSELTAAVQNAVEKALAQHGAVSIDKLWVGFVAPEAIATEENARKIAAQLTESAKLTGTPSVATISAPAPAAPAAGGAQARELRIPNIGHIIIGLIFENR
jgi:hypothetical protein